MRIGVSERKRTRSSSGCLCAASPLRISLCADHDRDSQFRTQFPDPAPVIHEHATPEELHASDTHDAQAHTHEAVSTAHLHLLALP